MPQELNFDFLLDQLDYIFYCVMNEKKATREEYEILQEAYKKGTEKNSYREYVAKWTYKDIYAEALKGRMGELLKIKLDTTGYGNPTTYQHHFDLHLLGAIYKAIAKTTVISCTIPCRPDKIKDKKGDGFKIKMLDPIVLLSVTDPTQLPRIKSQINSYDSWRFSYGGMYTHLINKLKTQNLIYSDHNTVGDKIIKARPKDTTKQFTPLNSEPLADWFIKLEFPTEKVNKDDKGPNPEKKLSSKFVLSVIDKDHIVYETTSNGKHMLDANGKAIVKKIIKVTYNSSHICTKVNQLILIIFMKS